MDLQLREKLNVLYFSLGNLIIINVIPFYYVNENKVLFVALVFKI